MDFYQVCVLILTAVFSLLGIYFIFFIRSAGKTLVNVNKTMEEVRAALDNISATAENTYKSVELINQNLPVILDDFRHTASSLRAVSESIELGLRKVETLAVPTFSGVTNLGNYVLKGYSIWKKIKKNRIPV